MKRAHLSGDEVDEVVFGCVGQYGLNAFLARMVGLRAGVRKEASAQTVNRLCASGLQAIVTRGDARRTWRRGRRARRRRGEYVELSLPAARRALGNAHGRRGGNAGGCADDCAVRAGFRAEPAHLHYGGKHRPALRLYPRADRRLRAGEPAPGARGHRGRTVSGADCPGGSPAQEGSVFVLRRRTPARNEHGEARRAQAAAGPGWPDYGGKRVRRQRRRGRRRGHERRTGEGAVAFAAGARC